MSDDDRRYYANELALRGLDAWITRDEREYDDGPDERDDDDDYPAVDFCGCCGVAIAGARFEVAQMWCDNCAGHVLPDPQWSDASWFAQFGTDCPFAEVNPPALVSPPVLLDEDEECPF